MIDREALRRDMRERRRAIVRRQAELDEWHCRQAELDEWREARQAKEPELIYSEPVWTPRMEEPVCSGFPDQTAPEAGLGAGDFTRTQLPEPDEPEFWLDVMAQALAESRADLRSEFSAVVEKAQAPLREQVARLEGQWATLMTLLGDKPARTKRVNDKPAIPLRLVTPDETADGA
jgi:hypothetical protein